MANDPLMTKFVVRCYFFFIDIDLAHQSDMIPLKPETGKMRRGIGADLQDGDRMLTNHTSVPRRLHAAGVIILTTSFILITTISIPAARAAVTFRYDTTLDLSAAGGRVHPTAVSCDPVTGEVCVTDVRQTTFIVLNARNVPLFRTSRFADLSLPGSGCLDRDGTIAFTDYAGEGRYAVRRLDIFGEPAPCRLESPAADWNPQLLSLAADGDYLTLAPRDGRLSRHDGATGALVWTLRVGDPQAHDTHFGRPCEAPDGRIYVPGGDQRVIYVVSADGQAEDAFGRFGSAPGRVVLPVGVAPGPGGTLLVLDRMRAKILVYGPDHEFVSEFGSMGAGLGQLYQPAALASSPDGKVYVAQGFEGRVQVFRVSDSAEPRVERSASSSDAACVVDRIALGQAAGTDRAATRSSGNSAAGSGFEPQVAAACAADRSFNLEAEQ